MSDGFDLLGAVAAEQRRRRAQDRRHVLTQLAALLRWPWT